MADKTDNGNDTIADRWLRRLKNQRVLAALFIFGVFVASLASFTESVSKLAKIVTGEQWQTREKADREILEIELRSPKVDSWVTLWRDEFAQPSILETIWECVLSNNGAVTLSIVSYKLQVERDAGAYWYDMLDRGMYAHMSRKDVSLPIRLGSGESVIVDLRVGLKIRRPAYEILEKEGLVGKMLPYKDIRDVVARHGLDIYCHHVKYHPELPEGSNRIEGPDPKETYKGQVITIIAKTGRKENFRAKEPWQGLASVWHKGR